MTLRSIIFELAPFDHGEGAFTGHHVHAWFLDAVRHLDAPAAEALHTSTRYKPFTLWAGPRFALGPGGVSRDQADDHIWLRATGLDAGTCALLERLTSDPPRMIQLGGHRLSPVRVLICPENHLWCGTSSFDELQAPWRDAAVSGRVRLLFLSPTAFAGRDTRTLLPLPSLVFGSLVHRWSQHAPEPFAPAVRDTLLGAIREESYDLCTAPPVDLGTHRLKGFVGTCEYSVGPNATAEIKRAIHALADFAFYSGVGLKTTMGMGQVICEEHV